MLNLPNSSKEKITQYYNHQFLKADKITKRDYQINIANACFDANTLVVLPTALGKTIIAVINAVNHLITYSGSKILILAPTKPLVTQHYETFMGLINEEADIKMGMLIGGVKPLDRALIINNSRIIFSTPQIIQNDLNLGSYNLKDFTLVIFDEAHKARFNYAYLSHKNICTPRRNLTFWD
jgi:ERCC4-related helicase